METLSVLGCLNISAVANETMDPRGSNRSINSSTDGEAETSLEPHCLSGLLRIITANLIAKSAPLVTFMVILMMVGTLGNGMVISVYQRKSTRSTAKIFMLMLGWLDLLSCVLLHPYAIFKLCHPFEQSWTTVCKVFEFLVHTTFCSSVCLLTAIAVDRYLAVCKALAFVRSRRVSYVMAGTALAVGCLGSLPILEFYGQLHSRIYDDSLGLSIPYVQCDFSDVYMTSHHVFWYTRMELLTFLICLAIIMGSYALVAFKLATRKTVGTTENQQETSRASTSQLTPYNSREYQLSKWAIGVWRSPREENGDGTTIKQCPVPEKRQASMAIDSDRPYRKRQAIPKSKPVDTFRVSLMLVVLTLAFLLSWLPLFLIKFGVMVGNENSVAFRPGRSFLLHTFYLNNVVNPVIYLAFQRQFRTETYLIIKRWCSRT